MDNFVPHGFWPSVAMIAMVVFLLFGVDLILFKARFVSGLGRILNKGFNVDKVLMRMLENLKSNSDREYDVEHTLLAGPGRFVVGGVLIAGAFILFNLLSLIK